MRKAEILLEFQNYIDCAPISPQAQLQQATSNDRITIESWRPTWIKNVQDNHATFGSFAKNSIGQLYKKHALKPAIVIGSGPSLKFNAQTLVGKDPEIPVVSCLHNFHFLEDLGVVVDYYVTLDAGEVTIEEVSEGGSKSADQYWEITKNRTLLAFIGTSPRLLEKWKGKVLFFNAPIPDKEIQQEIEAVEQFHCYVSNGGNVLGACMYIAKAFLGCNPIAFMGSDFCFGYDKKFHAWDSKYDKSLGNVVKLCDVFGNKVLSWQSYANFKGWFEYIAATAPGIYINCSEGGTFGSYYEGNIRAVIQMELAGFLAMYGMSNLLKAQCETPETAEKLLLF